MKTKNNPSGWEICPTGTKGIEQSYSESKQKKGGVLSTL